MSRLPVVSLLVTLSFVATSAGEELGLSGPRVVTYVVDGSAVLAPAAATIRDSIVKDVAAMKPEQRFNVLWVSEKGIRKLSPQFVPATDEGRKALTAFLTAAKFEGGPGRMGEALADAIKGRPEVANVFTASDLPAPTVDALTKANTLRIRISGFAFVAAKSGMFDGMQTLTRNNNGRFRLIDLSRLAPAKK